MAEEQVTEKSILNYVDKIRKLDLKKNEIRRIQERICDKLDVLMIPMAKTMERVKDNKAKIEKHWEDFGDNYNSIPTLHSNVPNFTESFGELVALNFEEREILVGELLKLLELADKQKIEIEPVEEVNPEKEIPDIKPKKKKKRTKKRKSDKLPQIEPEENETLPSKNKYAT